jgi:DNA polymerase-3 subunit delta
LDEYVYYANETGAAEVVALLEGESLFADARFILFRNAEAIKDKGDIAHIARWAASKNTASTLILASEMTKVDKKLEDCVPKDNKKIFWELFDNQKKSWLQNFFRAAHYQIDDEAVDTILAMVDNNTASFHTECSRFFLCFDKGHRIIAEDAENLLAHNRAESPFTLFDALADPNGSAARRLEQSALVLQRIRCSKETNAVSLLAGLAWCFRRLLDWYDLVATGRDNNTFELKKAGFGSPRAPTQFRNASRVWSVSDARQALALIADTDMELRSGLQQLEEVVLSRLLYRLVAKRRLP